MRLLVIGLVVVAGFKVWTQDRTYRAVMGEALVEAYRDHALEKCNRMPGKAGEGTQSLARTQTWTLAPGARAELGNPAIDVAIWDTNNPAWDKRYRHPTLVLTSLNEHTHHCTFDMADGTITVSP